MTDSSKTKIKNGDRVVVNTIGNLEEGDIRECLHNPDGSLHSAVIRTSQRSIYFRSYEDTEDVSVQYLHDARKVSDWVEMRDRVIGITKRTNMLLACRAFAKRFGLEEPDLSQPYGEGDLRSQALLWLGKNLPLFFTERQDQDFLLFVYGEMSTTNGYAHIYARPVQPRYDPENHHMIEFYLHNRDFCGFGSYDYQDHQHKWDFDGLEASCQMDDNTDHPYGYDLRYQTMFIDLPKAKRMARTLEGIESAMRRSHDVQHPGSFGDYVIRMAKAMGAAGIILRTGAATLKDGVDNMYTVDSLNHPNLEDRINWICQTLIQRLNPSNHYEPYPVEEVSK